MATLKKYDFSPSCVLEKFINGREIVSKFTMI